MESFDSFLNNINESKIKAKDVLITPDGRKQKIVFKSRGNNTYVLKIINTGNIIQGGRLTEDGISSILSFINRIMYPKWDSKFFKDNIVSYKVKKDKDRTEKIVMTVIPRMTLKNPDKYSGINFISTDQLNNPTIASIQNKEADKSIQEKPVDVSLESAKSDKNIVITDDISGSFMYSLKEPKNIAAMDMSMAKAKFTTTANGSLYYETPDGESAGTIDYYNGKIIAHTEKPTINNVELIGADKSFFMKAFTNADFLKHAIDSLNPKKKVEEKENKKDITFSGKFTLENVKNYLYDAKTHKKIFI